MRLEFSQEIHIQLSKIKKKDPKLFNKIQQKLNLSIENPRHPSLRTHKLHGRLKDSWSISIERDFRMVYTLIEDRALFYMIGKHEEVYR